MSNLQRRSPQEVFDDHLREARDGSFEDDIARNYAEDIVVLTPWGVFHGHDGVRELAVQLSEEVPNVTFEYRTTLVAGNMAMLEWAAYAESTQINDGVDSFWIQDGRIIAQTISYTVKPRA